MDQSVAILMTLKDLVSGPAKTVTGALRGVETAVTSISTAAMQMRDLILGALGVGGLMAFVNKSLDEARGAEEAAAKLKVALGTNVENMQRIKDLASELQRTTRVGDDAVIAAAAQLSLRDVPLDKLEESTKAAVALSQALGIDLNAAANQIAQTFQGIVPRGLGKTIPQLKLLTEEALKSGDAISLINGRFGNVATELAKNPFGRIDIAKNRIGDAFETIGGMLAPLAADITEKLATAVEGVASILQNDIVKEGFQKLVPIAQGIYDVVKNSIMFYGKAADIKLAVETAATGSVKATEDRAMYEGARADADAFLQRAEQRRATAAGLQASLEASIVRPAQERTAILGAQKARDLELANLEFLAKAKAISEDDYYRRKTALENKFVEDQIAKLETEKNRVSDAVKEAIASTARGGSGIVQGVSGAQMEALPDLVKRQVDLQTQLDVARSRQSQERTLVLLNQEKTLRGELNEKLKTTAGLLQVGSISSLEALDRNNKAIAEYNSKIDVTIASLRKLKEESTDPALQQALDLSIEKMEVEKKRVGEGINTFGKELKERVRSPLEGLFTDFITGATSAKDAFANFVSGMAQSLAQLASQIAANALLKSLFGGLGGAFGLSLPIPMTFAGGGSVPGPNVNADVVSARLTPGEYVVKKSAVQHYGVSTLEAMNRMLMPRMSSPSVPMPRVASQLATGGVAGDTTQAPVLPILAANDATLASLLQGGSSAYWDFMSQNRDRLRAITG